MEVMFTKVENKLLEYGFDIYDQHPAEKNTYVFMVQDMILFVDDKNNTLDISFQATTKPDVVANHMLILQEIEDINLRVMDSFIFIDKHQMVHGDKAYEIVQNSVESKAIEDYNKKMHYNSILCKTNNECYQC